MPNPFSAYAKAQTAVAEAHAAAERRRAAASRDGDPAGGSPGEILAPKARGKLLITRPLEDAVPLAERLTADGFSVLIEPMLSIRHRPVAGVDLAGAAALIFTSAHGVRAFVAAFLKADARRGQREAEGLRQITAAEALAIPVFCVGDQTAEAATEAGFTTVRSAAGTSTELAALIVREAAAGSFGEVPAAVVAGRAVGGPHFLHIRGRDKAGDVTGTLARAGLATREAVLYEAEAATQLSGAVRRALDPRRIASDPADPERLGGVLLFSPRTAETLVALVTAAGLADGCRGAVAWCLSAAVAEAAAPLPWRRRAVAPWPHGDALVEIVRAG